MFVEIAKLMTNCDLNITLSLREGKLHAIVLPKSKDEKQSNIAPMSLCGTPEEYETGFLTAISAAIPKVDAFITDMQVMQDTIDKQKAEKAEKTAKKSETAKPSEKKETVKEEKVAKVNHADEYKKGLALFNDAKYAEAEPHLVAAVTAKPDNKTYQEKLKICQSWISRLKENGLFNTQEEDSKATDTIVPTEETPFVDNPVTTAPEEDDELNFSLEEN